MKKILSLAILFAYGLTPLFSQDKKTEIEVTRDFGVVSSGVMGNGNAYAELLNSKPVKNKLAVTYKIFDHALKELASIDASINVGEQYQCNYADSQGIYSMYAKSLSGAFSFLYYNDGSVKTINGVLGPKADCDKIIANGNMALAQVSDKDNNDFVLTADFITGKSTPVILNKQSPKADVNIISLSFNKQYNQYYVVYTLEEKKVKKLCLMTIDKELKPGEPMIVSTSSGEEKFLMTASMNPVGNNEFIVCGAYQNGSGEFANGLYIGRWKNSAWSSIKYYSFADDFKHFTDYLSNKEKDRSENKKEKAAVNGKEFDLDVLMITHSLLNIKGTYVLIGEIYYPEYARYTDKDGVSQRVFMGYRYPKAVIVGFNAAFEKMWDNSFSVGLLGGTIPEEIVNVQVIEDKIFLFFENGNTIQSIRFNSDGEIDEDRKTRGYSFADEGESFTAGLGGDVSYWFDEYFLANMTVKEKSSGGKRWVFYMKKISLNETK
ncbi:MAG: hypothetical protein M3R17_15285 [Bacteroidota bacterium]|nr:hypothetical protein [Bacteroidota bacterium]